MLPHDPKSGSDSQTNYKYLYTTDGHCALYANFENTEEPVTLPSISSPTPNVGAGFFKASTVGPNGTDLYYQIGR
jgi:hypothetical protein